MNDEQKKVTHMKAILFQVTAITITMATITTIITRRKMAP